MMNRPESVSNWTPKMPTEELCCSKVLKPNAKDNKDSLTPESPYKQSLGGTGKSAGPFGSRGRGF